MTAKKGYWDLVPEAVEPWKVWDGAGTANAPTGLGYSTLGFDSSGVPAGKVYIYDDTNDVWRDTTQTVAGFFGI